MERVGRGSDGAVPELVAEKWGVVRERAEIPLEQLADGREWRVCEALLTLHAIADEACAGLFVALDVRRRGVLLSRPGPRAVGETGCLARIHTQFVRVLPKIRTPPTGRASFSRYACVYRPGLETRWHKMPLVIAAPTRAEHAQLLLLPWPLRVRESDFRGVEGSVQRLAKEPFGFFEFAPEERLDLDLVDRVLSRRAKRSAASTSSSAESAVEESEIDALEALLDRHGVTYLQAGVRGRSGDRAAREQSDARRREPEARERRGASTQLLGSGSTSARTSIIAGRSTRARSTSTTSVARFTRTSAGGRRSTSLAGRSRSSKSARAHDRVAGVRGPRADDEVAELIRAIGPTIVSTALLDGPQLTSRWSARYASVLADDPGSAVMTLTSFGMAQRSRPAGFDASPVIALWKDPARGTREISLEPGAQGVLLTVCGARATRRSADGRWPVEAGPTTSTSPSTRSGPRTRPRRARTPAPVARHRR